MSTGVASCRATKGNVMSISKRQFAIINRLSPQWPMVDKGTLLYYIKCHWFVL